jgi:Flp pilus assembly secretin CpaC
VECKVKFRLQDESLLKLKTDLAKTGFKVLEGNNKSGAPGSLAIESSGNIVFISGSVSSRGELDRINSILSTYSWLKIKRDDTKNVDDYCYAVINVTTTPMLLEVDVAFVGVTDKEADTIGMNLLQNGLGINMSVGAGRGPVSYQVSSGLNATLQAISGSGPGRFKSVGHLTFKNDATDWKSFQDGGTITIPIMGANGGVGTQPIDYGLMLKVKGGLADADNVALDLEVELSAPFIQGNSPAGPIYDLKRSRMGSTILCPLGKTLIMAGTKQLTEGLTVSGTPFLSQIPLLNFLFSQKSQTRDERRVLILISPQISRAPTPAPPAVEQTIGTMQDANKPVTTLREKKETR